MRILKDKSSYNMEFLKLLNLRNSKYTSEFLAKRLKKMLFRENGDYIGKTLWIDINNLYIKKKKQIDIRYSKIANNLSNNIVNNSYTDNNFYIYETENINNSFSSTVINDYSLNTIDLSDNEIASPTLDLSDNEIVFESDALCDIIGYINKEKLSNMSTFYIIINEFKILNYNLDNEGYQVKTITI